jgi:uncharacterized protein involved in exopolysaccharide biosynthesis
MSASAGHSESAPDSASTNGATPAAPSGREGSSQEEGHSLLDLLLTLSRNRLLILYTLAAVTFAGVFYALSASETYTSSAKVIQESSGKVSPYQGGISALQQFGVNVGGATGDGLSVNAYPQLLQSRAVHRAVLRDTFRFPDAEKPMTLLAYLNREPGLSDFILRYTLRLPWTLKSYVGDLADSDDRASGGTGGSSGSLTGEEKRALKQMAGMAEASFSQANGLLEITARASDPQLAANLAESFVRNLSDRVRTIQTKKKRDDLNFVEQRFGEAQTELESAENRLADFLERNQAINSPALRFQEDRLRRQVRFKEQLYSQLQKQLTQMRLDLQRERPVLTVVEAPEVPLSRTSPQRTLIVIISFFLGGLLGIGVALGREFLQGEEGGEEEEKVEQIRHLLHPRHIIEDLKEHVGLAQSKE